MLKAAGPNFWLADGPVVQFFGVFPYPTRMAAARLEDGSLWVWSPIALDDALAAELDAIGPVRELVAPNKLHHLALPEWVARYPEARLHGAPGLARKRRDLAFHTELGDTPDPAWVDQIDQVVFRGSVILDEVLFFHRRSRTALVTDLIQRFEPDTLPAWCRPIMRWDGLVGPAGAAPRDFRATVWNRRAARACRATALAWQPARLVIAHGTLPEEDGTEALRRGFRWLGPER
ncbi:MAG: DUF4336 domain-containing protein [Myxococcota bacterium]|jgi:hypothetical protein|nr:hypothetical protein [Deltaproteobacteria bacterium]MCP4245189.1 DUF4336 domain-containing protein [bacterium]MDP6074086.1 DUF4336 domain-containing protein [Myxococcota bacterium]MDP6243289.1 DUF4336 domain-containing protein [Myxococcota bacterium]MDP7074027.1 DUF4336 domain-containing protein [Myxococcota bacterium]